MNHFPERIDVRMALQPEMRLQQACAGIVGDLIREGKRDTINIFKVSDLPQLHFRTGNSLTPIKSQSYKLQSSPINT